MGLPARPALVVPAAIAWLASAGPAPAQEPAGAGPETIMVHLADGTSLLLRSWSFSYEYASWAKGQAPTHGNTDRRETRDLWVGKKALALADQTLEIEYGEERRVVDGEPRNVPVARGLALVSREGKRTKQKGEPPHRDLLLPEARDRLAAARALDVRGETIGGTRREFCLLSYTPLVQCPTESDRRVERIQFRP